ncbi:MAG: efflux RND transporter permease subunit [Elusimicrobia bacterium]|nr:efflux RND transporter permease subunit [Elusimicrobiota bacterium]
MIEKLVRFSVNNRGLVFALALILAGLGWTSFQALPIDAVPDITNNQVQVNTAVEASLPRKSGATSPSPLQRNSMGSLADLVQTRSISQFDATQVTPGFRRTGWTSIALSKWNRAAPERRFRSQQESPGLASVTTGLGEVCFYTLQASARRWRRPYRSQLMGSRASRLVCETRLLTVPGVYRGQLSIGGFEK